MLTIPTRSSAQYFSLNLTYKFGNELNQSKKQGAKYAEWQHQLVKPLAPWFLWLTQLIGIELEWKNSKIALTQLELLIPPTAVAGNNFELSSKEETLCFLPPCIRKLPKDNIKGHHHSSTVSPWGISHHDEYHHPKQCVHFRFYFSQLLIYTHWITLCRLQ